MFDLVKIENLNFSNADQLHKVDVTVRWATVHHGKIIMNYYSHYAVYMYNSFYIIGLKFNHSKMLSSYLIFHFYMLLTCFSRGNEPKSTLSFFRKKIIRKNKYIFLKQSMKNAAST